MPYFPYDEAEIQYLKQKDPKLAAAIDEIGLIQREIIPDLFTALAHQIISQQISTKAALTVWNRIHETLGEITPASVAEADTTLLQQCGTSTRKILYIQEMARAVLSGTLDLDTLRDLPDEAVCARLSQLKGIGEWTAEMLMTFSMARPDVMSWDDIAIHRGLRMLHRHRRITRELFQKYKRRYSPYGSVASLYLWAISDGQCQGLYDPAPLSSAQKKANRKKTRCKE